ncbi:hypothetical protein ElyMa_003106200 [Elysia marginata]|uniref:Uncharacterized protein n=1 Tax=Elysia marginata TaxID=1093978 RepID=A0AAV4ISK7_9GAST|nr:hypothetical protein ElyMa_003106200 [Elysia marginata]
MMSTTWPSTHLARGDLESEYRGTRAPQRPAMALIKSFIELSSTVSFFVPLQNDEDDDDGGGSRCDADNYTNNSFVEDHGGEGWNDSNHHQRHLPFIASMGTIVAPKSIR